MTTDNKKIVQEIFKNRPTINVVYMNPKGEFFTDESNALNSLPKDKEGNRVGEIKTTKRAVKKK